MAVGHYKILAIIQARLGSQRLPDKVLLPLPANSNNSVLDQIIKTLKDIKEIDETIIATSLISKNDILEEYCFAKKVPCFRGSEEDVLSRFYEIVKDCQYHYVIRLTADNPIIDSKILKRFIINHIDKQLEYSRTEDLPLGCNFEMMSTNALIIANKEAIELFQREHVTPYIINNTKNKEIFKVDVDEELRELRLTLDYPSDYAFLNLLYNLLNTQFINDLSLIKKVVDQNIWLKQINSSNYQKQRYANFNEELSSALPILKTLEFNRLVDLLKKYK